MRKIMFNDKYGLTDAVLRGWKTMTRRSIPTNTYVYINFKELERGNNNCYHVNDGVADYREASPYKIGEIVAVAQSYSQLNSQRLLLDDGGHTLENSKGWNNKMFVKASLMPHQIRITNVRIERLQKISDEDCLREGIEEHLKGVQYGHPATQYCGQYPFSTPRAAFIALIDKVSGKGTWNRNDYVWVYEFELVK